MQPTGTQPQMDQQAVNLAKAIRQHESAGNFNANGKSGEHGAYQWTPDTWKGHAQMILGDSNAQMTPQNQNAVAYGVIKTWKDKGLNAAQIAAKWNSGSETGWENKIGRNSMGVEYNVPAYVKSVTDIYQQYKRQTPTAPSNTPAQIPQATNPNESNAGVDTQMQAAGKTAANFFPSLFNFGKGIIESVNPINTIKNLGGIANEVGQLNTNTLKQLPNATYESVIPQAGRSLVQAGYEGVTGQDNTQSLKDAQNAIVNDPVGQIAPFLLAAEGGARLADTHLGGLKMAAERSAADFNKTGVDVMPKQGVFQSALDNTISKTGQLVTKPIGATGSFAGGIAKSAASHLTGLDTKSIQTIIEHPEAFSKLAQDQASRGGLANEFGKAVDDFVENKSQTGSEYNPIRQSVAEVRMPESFLESEYAKQGLEIKDGKVTTNTEAKIRDPKDIRALQNLYDTWGKKETVSANEFLNLREDVSKNLARFEREIGKSTKLDAFGQDLYAEVNRTMRPQIDDLQGLDARMSPLIQDFKQITKDFLQKDPNGGYTFKDGAINKIANAGGVGRDALLARMEKILPGITKKIEILKAVEDIEKAKGIKVGTYARGAVEGFGIVTGNIPAVVAAIITNPSIAVPLIRGLGWSAAKVGQVVSTLKMIAGDPNHFKIDNKDKPIPTPYAGKNMSNFKEPEYKVLQKPENLDMKIESKPMEMGTYKLGKTKTGRIEPTGQYRKPEANFYGSK